MAIDEELHTELYGDVLEEYRIHQLQILYELRLELRKMKSERIQLESRTGKYKEFKYDYSSIFE